MSKAIDTTIVLKDFEGNPLTDQNKKEVTLKAVLLNYLQNCHAMGVTSENEKLSAYLAGLAIGSGGASTQLEQAQYDIIKKLVDGNKIKMGNSEEQLYGIVVQQQVKQILDQAENVKEKSKS